MSDPYFQQLFAQRIGGANYGKGTEIYKFEKIKRAKRKALAEHPERKLVDFGIGENDEMADESVRRVMAEEINKPQNRGYADNGIQAYKDAVARFMQREFGVELNAVTEINHCIGTKTALAMTPAVFIDPGDVTLLTVPGYPVAGTHTKYYGGEVHRLPLLPENDFFPDLDSIPADVRRRAKLLVINYPNSPTGKAATSEFYAKVVEFARANEVVVVQDATHMMLSYDAPPLSFLQTPGAREVGIEVHSMSKGWNMIGWRLGWFCGNERIVRALADVKDNCDSGQFMATQVAAAAALDNPEIPRRIRAKYKRRLEKLVATLRRCGFDCKMPGGSFFLYTRSARAIASGQQFPTAEAFSQYLITEHSICTVPWDDAGPHLRFSVTYEAADEAAEDALMAETERRMRQIGPVF
jgi:LL-diaminopimelate aminotransferase